MISWKRCCWSFFTRLHFILLECLLLLLLINGTEATSSSIRLDIGVNQVYERTKKIMKCITVGNVKEWQLEGHRLVADSRIKIEKSYLTITSTRLSDDGNYKCVAEIGGRRATSEAQTLQVYRRMPQDGPPMPSVSVQTGSDVTLIFGGRYFILFKWKKDGIGFTPGEAGYRRFRSKTSNRGVELRIVDVAKTDSGTYVCELLSLTTQYRKVNLFVEDPVVVPSTEAVTAPISTGTTSGPIQTSRLPTTLSFRYHTTHSRGSHKNTISATTFSSVNTLVSVSSSFTSDLRNVTSSVAKTTKPPSSFSATIKNTSNPVKLVSSTCTKRVEQANIPKWVLVVIAICLFCLVIPACVCLIFFVKRRRISKHRRNNKSLDPRQCQEREASDVSRLYETIPEEIEINIINTGPFSNSSVENSVENTFNCHKTTQSFVFKDICSNENALEDFSRTHYQEEYRDASTCGCPSTAAMQQYHTTVQNAAIDEKCDGQLSVNRHYVNLPATCDVVSATSDI